MTHDYNRTKTANRKYTNAKTDAADIAAEIVNDGESRGWGASSDREMEVASEIEHRLSRFNMGYIDDMAGGWGFTKGGSTFFKGS